MKFIKLDPKAIIPTRKHPTDAGLDLCSTESGVVLPHNNKIFHTGICVEIPADFVGLVWPKSRHDFLIGGGVIDCGYQGEILVKIINPFDYTIYIGEGQAIAQLIVQKVYLCGMELVDHFEARTERGATGGIVNQVIPFTGDISEEDAKKYLENQSKIYVGTTNPNIKVRFTEEWKEKDLPQYDWNKPDIT